MTDTFLWIDHQGVGYAFEYGYDIQTCEGNSQCWVPQIIRFLANHAVREYFIEGEKEKHPSEQP
jgi:hypothetical protein